MNRDHRCRQPSATNTRDGEERRVGVEIELSGLDYEVLVKRAAELLGGSAHATGRYVSQVETSLGTFTVELDSDPIKDLDLQDDRLPESIQELGGHAMDLIDYAAERIVPLELISPPLPFSKLDMVESLCDGLRASGALGSREALIYAFGLQLNPELPSTDAGTLINYLRAFALLYDWLKSRHQLDISRKFTPYIEPWHHDYIDLLMSEDYAPDLDRLMEDYLWYNPTRNRALDLLPLFAYLDRDKVTRHVQDARIKARPTLHYRLPDCDIDNPEWHFSRVWNDWVVLDNLACDARRLTALTEEFRDSRKIRFRNLATSWKERCHEWLIQNPA
ncbi:hypothetical protein CF392_09595 [Tamilnaduibacter salinus]|uniref:Amidoligase enzyme n=1 Tax=Tamilnaduibacter salinus TaxID=1484056 RepID=A0A2A2I337_9GAMM|nr:amidoligase family protein [Tamilnaduibacter salinus]PAV25714.1 hypothetical protein CF392_09595 [Tamilnaduibacter salinus]